jgi:sulfite oxidase
MNKTPFNAEPPLSILAENFITPTEFFYVRNHLPVPHIDEADFALEVEGSGADGVNFTVEDIKKRVIHSVASRLCGLPAPLGYPD